MTNEFKDPLIISLLFFGLSSDWFDNWMKETFSSFQTMDPLVFTMLKTILFGFLYWLIDKKFLHTE